MPAPRGKRVALLTGALSLAVLMALGIAGRRRITEEYYLWMLGLDDESNIVEASKALGLMRSVRAVPELIKKLSETEPSSELVQSPLSGEDGIVFGPLAYALVLIGPDALPGLRKAYPPGHHAWGMVPWILDAIEFPYATVRSEFRGAETLILYPAKVPFRDR